MLIDIEPPKIGEKHGQSNLISLEQDDRLGSRGAPVDGSPRVLQFRAAMATTLACCRAMPPCRGGCRQEATERDLGCTSRSATGCTESILRAEHPTLEKLIRRHLARLSRDLCPRPPAIRSKWRARRQMAENKGKYIRSSRG